MSYREQYGKNWIIPGMEVADLDCPMQKKRVEGIVRREKVVGGRKMTLVVGVKCNWYDTLPNGEKKFNFGTFHTKLLVPWEVALGGSHSISMFLNRFDKDGDTVL